MFQNSEIFRNHEEYLTELLQHPAREKPIVEYLPTGIAKIVVGKSAYIITYGHPAGYLDEAPYVITSAVVSYDKVTGDLETRNTKYVLKKVDMQ